MLKSVILKNIQCHKYLKADFVNGLNIIVGTSDIGKSAILRGINLALTNRPIIGIEGFKNWDSTDEEPMSVELIFDNGNIIWKREKGKTSYEINGKKLSTLNRDLPYEVPLLSNMSSLNFQSQSDTYFLLNDTPGEVARKLGDIVGLSIIGEVLKKLGQFVSKAKEEKETAANDVKEIDTELNSLPSPNEIKLIRGWIKELEISEEKIGKNKEDIRLISESAITIQEYEELLEEYTIVISLEKSAKEIDILNSRIKNNEEVIRNIEKSSGKLERLIVEEKESFALIELNTLASEIRGLNGDIDKNIMSISSLTSSLEKTAKFSLLEVDLNNKVEGISGEYISLLKSTGKCPTCFNDIDNKTIDKIIDNLGGNG